MEQSTVLSVSSTNPLFNCKNVANKLKECGVQCKITQNNSIVEKEHNGYMFDKINRNDGLYQYMIYIPELNTLSRITCNNDEENYSKVVPIKGDVNIALYHGAVRGSLTDTDWQLEGEINLGTFEGFAISIGKDFICFKVFLCSNTFHILYIVYRCFLICQY